MQYAEIAKWFDALLQVFGLGISCCAYRMSRKTGYLIVAVYFFVAACSLTVIPKIRRTLYERRHPRTQLSAVEQEEYANESLALQQKYFPSSPRLAGRLNISFPLGSILLVMGIWVLARQEPKPSAAN
jgi:hypothetical protein